MSVSTILEYEKQLIKDFIKSSILKLADFYLVGGKMQQKLIEKFVGFESYKCSYYGYNSRDNSFFMSVKKEKPIFNLCVGRFVDRKNKN
jgi:hypothetical protein